MDEITVIKGSNGYIIYGPFCSTMKADVNKNVTYSNLNADCAPYKRMLNALKKVD